MFPDTGIFLFLLIGNRSHIQRFLQVKSPESAHCIDNSMLIYDPCNVRSYLLKERWTDLFI